MTLMGCRKEELKPEMAGAAARNGSGEAGAVYTLSNQTSGNSVLRYTRLADGTLTAAGSFATGGTGTGMGLGSQGALIMSEDGSWLFAVNAGSNSVSVMQVGASGLSIADTEPSGGMMPVSLTQYGSWLYVLNAGGTANITGFYIGANGQLTPIPNSTRALSTAMPAPAQVNFNQDGTALIVTEKSTNIISSFPVDASGMPGMLKTFPSAGQTPFGFSLGHHGQFYVTEAWGGAPGQSTVSSYMVDAAANVTLLHGPVPIFQTAACWAVTLNNGKMMYTTNTGSGNLSSLAIDNTGLLALLHGAAGVTGPGSEPIDADLSNNSKFLYALEAGTDAISAFSVNKDGTLSLLDEETGLPDGAAGLAAK